MLTDQNSIYLYQDNSRTLFRKIESFIYIAIFIIAVNPVYLSYYKELDTIKNISLSLAFIFMLINTILTRGLSKNIFKKYVICNIYFLLYIISTVINGRSILTLIRTFGDGILLLLYVNYFFSTRKVNLFLKYTAIASYILISLNWLSIILFPEGLYFINGNKYFFFGQKNNCASLSFSISMFIMLYELRKATHLNTKIITMLCSNFLMALFVSSSTSIVSIAMSILFLLLFPLKKIQNVYSKIVIASVIISLVLTISPILITRIRFISAFITNVLKKDLTFTSRTIIWARAYEHLVNKHRLLFGNGYETKEILLILGLSHAHNTWLNFLYRGGIILMTSMAVITYIASKRLNIYMHTKNLHGKIIGMYLIFYMICFLTEANDGGSNFYMFLVTLYFIFNFDQLSQQQTS